ncbi:hypothetical protein DLAC_11566 [Tieghemostelium lacteum]|uniref:V-type proton ATPase subunit S1/VOA1 transmembrane domain-containing protein n=1 Tax=Tieghemostelium lacteum TaxID=361077 RepID=A0A152A1C2_TIELA|nr:hypothetical protein DLAC_11566 [Tieghemostelium lacteum]|eukprot:KYQ99916.1 hypothetical protein DLAC_11566 [Tieghemostelium lacteum]
MRKALSLFLVFNIILGAALASVVPIMGWSSRDKLFDEKEIKTTYKSEQFKSLLQNILIEKDTEIVTIFVEPRLRSDEISKIFDSYSTNSNGGSFKDLKKFFEDAKSTTFIPLAESYGHFVSSVLSKLSIEKSNIYIAKDESSLFKVAYANIVSLDSLPKSILSNKIVDILVVVLPDNQDYSQHNSIIKKVQSFIGDNDYVSFFTSESGSAVDMALSFPVENNIESLQAGSGSAPTPTPTTTPTPTPSNSGYFNYFTGPIIETYFVVSILLAILFSGICCLADLQVPDRYESPKQKIL